MNASAGPDFLFMMNARSVAPEYSDGPGKLSRWKPIPPRLFRSFLPALLALLVPLFPGTAVARDAGASPPAAAKYDQPRKDWYEGPVRYLIRREEEKQYRALPSDAERAKFIDDFWARRDDVPSTPANEFRIRFWNRVEEADRLFHDAPYPGWKTDRGKLYILLGPPDEIRQGQVTGRLGKEIPFVIWLYHQPRFEGMDRDTEIRFLPDDSGEMRISDQLVMNRMERLMETNQELLYRAGAAQNAPEPKQLLDAIAASRPPLDPKRFRTHYDFFLAADGSTSVVLTVGVRAASPAPSPEPAAPPPAPGGAWKVFARFSDGAVSHDLVDPGSFRTSEIAADVDGFRLFQGRISVPPGSYSVFCGIQDPASQELFSLSDRVIVPDFSGDAFTLSSITLAARLEPAEHPSGNDPFLVGRMTVVPKMDPVFKSGSDLAYYFQVYHARFDPGTGQASLDLTYQFFQATALKKTGDPEFSPIGKPVFQEKQPGQVHGYAIPLTGWPAGEFKVRVQVRDRVADRTAESEARFSVR